MGMIGSYLRVSAAELAKVIDDPEWGIEHAGEAMEAEYDSASEARVWDTDKAWHAIAFLLERRNFPVDIVYGEVEFTQLEWVYGPPKYLTAQHVKEAAHALSELPFAALVEGVDPAALTAAEIYPGWDWASDDCLEYVADNYADLLPFFQAAANADEAIVVWIA
ncbi:YfbM family protein [Kibdelosporangium philippinense]|uniref:YfbM family protein n=1 Tax=Kibdelosporangium philippinense TaxID=211113 RepID=A0ABS8Z1R5_9PSEU|nr:YfbM family protein [Kibdelosporangium philippinense]MCE7001876.1 YfbM family protein [Kibdelosporangium philippinense]